MSDVNFSLEGKVVMVTGASSGFGQRFAPVLARCGAKLVVAARRRDPLLALEEEIENDGGRCLAVGAAATTAERETSSRQLGGWRGSNLQVLQRCS